MNVLLIKQRKSFSRLTKNQILTLKQLRLKGINSYSLVSISNSILKTLKKVQDFVEIKYITKN